MPDLNTKTPKILVPNGACDTHAHVFGPKDKYPPRYDRRYDPPDCTIARYKTMLQALGVKRGVLVQSSAYGSDNRVLLDALREGGDNFRGVALLSPDITVEELEQLHEQGIRGVRTSTLPNAAAGPEGMETLANKVEPLGWPLLVHLQHISEWPVLAPVIPRLSTPCLIDNCGRIRGNDGIDYPCFQALLSLYKRTENCWLKLCSFYRLSDQGPPSYSDMAPFVRALVEICPDRLVWGTNWPHPNCPIAMPNDGDLFDILFGWIDDDKIRHKILVDNPSKLFGFS